jgi:hypothetical protein
MGVATGVFTLPNGSPVANGLWQFKLCGDAIQYSVACVCPVLFFGNLDPNGTLTATFLFNDVLSIAAGSTCYQLTVKSNAGAQVWNEMYYLSGTVANLNTMAPGGSGCGGGNGSSGSSGLVLETNGGVNSSQVLLNLVNGVGITMTNSAGATTINTTALTAIPARTGLLGYNFSGGGQAVSPAATGQIYIPVPMTITGWNLTADQTGSAAIAVLACSYANFPGSLTSITSADVPTLAGAIKNENLNATTWAGSLASQSVLQFSVTSASTVQTLNVGLVVSIPYA